MKSFSRFYVNHIIKNPFIFYAFLSISISAFVWMSLITKINIMRTYSATIVDQKIVLNDTVRDIPIFEEVYVYRDRNEKVIHISTSDINRSEDIIYIHLTEAELIELLEFEEVNIDVVIGHRTLLETIFIRAGRG